MKKALALILVASLVMVASLMMAGCSGTTVVETQEEEQSVETV